jgi:hypothetical protein
VPVVTAVSSALLFDERCAGDIDSARELSAASVAPAKIEEYLKKWPETMGWLH